LNEIKDILQEMGLSFGMKLISSFGIKMNNGKYPVKWQEQNKTFLFTGKGNDQCVTENLEVSWAGHQVTEKPCYGIWFFLLKYEKIKTTMSRPKS